MSELKYQKGVSDRKSIEESMESNINEQEESINKIIEKNLEIKDYNVPI